MDQFVEVLLEDAGDHVATLENLLLCTDAAAPVDEDLNAIFRAANVVGLHKLASGLEARQALTVPRDEWSEF
jgi:chemotaxis protein histidine kinase CheA